MADSPHNKSKTKDMYWFAHGGEPLPDKNQHGDEDLSLSSEQHNSPSWKPIHDRKALPEETANVQVFRDSAASIVGGTDSSPPLSVMERDDRVTVASRNIEVEKPKTSSEAAKDRNDARAKKKLDRDATLEARRNAQRSSCVSFAFGSSLPRNLDLDVTTIYQGSDLDSSKRRSTPVPASLQKTEERWAYKHTPVFAAFKKNTQPDKAHPHIPVNLPQNCLMGSGVFIADDKMSQSMTSSSISACRGRRKTDLTPTVPYERTAPPRTPVPSASARKRSVSMTRLDQLAQPRRSYLEAQKGHPKSSSASSNSSVQKDVQNSPIRPRSSASEHSAGSNRPATAPAVNMRARATTRKPRPVSIAGTMPDRSTRGREIKNDSRVHHTPEKKTDVSTSKKAPVLIKTRNLTPKSSPVEKVEKRTPIKNLTPKSSPIRKLTAKAKKLLSPAAPTEPSADTAMAAEKETSKVSTTPSESLSTEEDVSLSLSDDKSNNKRIISEEEAKAALAEKRKLAREQAEKEAELERQLQEELKLQEVERIRKEEEDQRLMEEEQLCLVEEHHRQEEEKLRKAIEEQERKERDEKFKREEEARLKAEQEKKSKEEAERQRIELEEKLRKEEEERAERKKRLEKIMSRTRGKGGAMSSGSSQNGGDQSDSADSQAGEALSGDSSLTSVQSSDPSSGDASLEIRPENLQGSETESLNSMDMIALSDNSSLDSNLLMLPSEGAPSLESDQTSTLSTQNLQNDENAKAEFGNFVASTDELNEIFSTSGDNSCSYSSESITNNVAGVPVLPTENKPNMVVHLSEENLEAPSNKFLDYGIDSIQTLVSQGDGVFCNANPVFPVSEPLALSSEKQEVAVKQDMVLSENIDGAYSGTSEIADKAASEIVSHLENFAMTLNQESADEIVNASFLGQLTISDSQSKLSDVTSELFDASSEMFIQNALNLSEVQGQENSVFDLAEPVNVGFNPFTENSPNSFITTKEDITHANGNPFAKAGEPTGDSFLDDLKPSALNSGSAGVNLLEEQFVNASVTDSEDSSLDSNLSQIMNVDITHNAIPEENNSVSNGLSGITLEHFINNDYTPNTNGYQNHVLASYAQSNGVDGDNKTSKITAGYTASIDKEINSNVIPSINHHVVGNNILNSGDFNFNKVPSNSFLATDDCSEMPENQFVNQEEIMKNTIQTGFHS